MSTKITSVAIVNSTVDSTTIGQTTPAAGAFTTPASSDNSTNAATTAWAKLGFAVSLGTNGYIKLPSWLGGLIIQWGYIAGSAGPTYSASFNISFPSACFNLQLTSYNTALGNTMLAEVLSISTSGFTWQRGTSSPTDGQNNIFWLAVGN